MGTSPEKPTRRRENRQGARHPILVATRRLYTGPMKAKIYHNPRCSKSRATLALLTAKDIDVEIIDYLATPPSRATLRRLLGKLDEPALAMVRTDEPEFRAHAGRSLTDDEVIDLLASHPRLLQRPIVEIGARARIGRPPERVLEIVA
jgi:arsenate reductase